MAAEAAEAAARGGKPRAGVVHGASAVMSEEARAMEDRLNALRSQMSAQNKELAPKYAGGARWSSAATNKPVRNYGADVLQKQAAKQARTAGGCLNTEERLSLLSSEPHCCNKFDPDRFPCHPHVRIRDLRRAFTCP